MRPHQQLPSPRSIGLFLIGFGMAVGQLVYAQVPDKFTNLKVLPKGTSKADLIETMRGFSFALGVRCEHCHARATAPAPGAPKLDFASDERPPKRVARRMMRMVRDINRNQLAKLDPPAKLQVGCVTCHHGVPRPEALASLLRRTTADSGLSVALARYRSLRQEYYGTDSYDFSETSLNTLAEALLRDKNPAEAVTWLELNEQDNPKSGWLQNVLGEAYLASGDRDKARSAFAKAVELDPDNPRPKKRLEELSVGAKAP